MEGNTNGNAENSLLKDESPKNKMDENIIELADDNKSNNDVIKDTGRVVNEQNVNVANTQLTLTASTITDVDDNEVITTTTTPQTRMQTDDEQSFDLRPNLHVQCVNAQQQLRADYEVRIEQLRVILEQKQNMIDLLQREHRLLEKEKQSYCRETELAKKEKESTVIKFAMQEKLVIDAKKEKELVEKQLADAKRKIDSNAIALQAFTEEKTRLASVIDRKCQEMQTKLREYEKLKSEYNHMESKFKYANNKLNIEMEARIALEKKLEEHPSKLEEKALEQFKVEYSAKSILLSHELERKTELINNLNSDLKRITDAEQQLKEQLNKANEENTQLSLKMQQLQDEHSCIQGAYSDELLKTSKLRGQLEDLQLLRTQNMLNEEKLEELEGLRDKLLERLQDARDSIKIMQIKEQELLDINKEMSESITQLQNDNSLMTCKLQAIETEIEIMRKEKCENMSKLAEFEEKLQNEEQLKNRDRNLLARHLSEKTKLYEMTKIKFDNLMGDFEANQNKHNTIVKELKRELQKYKRLMAKEICENGGSSTNASNTLPATVSELREENTCNIIQIRKDSQCSERSAGSSSIDSSSGSGSGSVIRVSASASESVKSDTVVTSESGGYKQHEIKGVTKKHLVERILRLQQLTARQAEKIDFLENHALSLVNELQKKSRLVQYYTLRDHSGALTSSKSDQNKEDISRYGNGVMSSIYNGAKSDMKTNMTLELSLEINKKLQAVLEDTLLKNITLKENVDVLGLEVESLSTKLRDSNIK